MEKHTTPLLHLLAVLLCMSLLLNSCGPKWAETENGTVHIVTNQGGATLGYSPSSGVCIPTVDRFAFKDLNKNGGLDPYEDWRLSAEDRAESSALLPLQISANMTIVEKQMENVPFDMEVHIDAAGNAYDFGFGPNWQDVISDERTERYGKVVM